ncbi:MAG: hypothetical protein NTZ59_00615 [Bacteroidetes bacterium]|nr:hypothetical protein [Bacteroidota bacterium]
MHSTKTKQTIKSYIAIAIFLVFWIVAFAYLFFEKKVTQKTPNFSWAYSQAFHQSWSFFSQPAIYNDKLIFVIKRNNKTDSVDILDELWKAKRSKWNYARENVWDHIMYRQMRKLRSKLQEQKLISFSIKDSLKYCQQLTDKDNVELLQNIEVFGKEILQQKGFATSGKQFKILLYTNYTKPFKNEKRMIGDVLEFETHWKYFNN